MKALFGMAEAVPLARVTRDYRSWVVVLGAALAVNIGILGLVVVPMFSAADAAERRAAGAAEALAAARAELAAAEQTRDGSAQAAKDLQRFYTAVLPTDVAAARRITHLKLSQMARDHDVTFQRSAASPEEIRGSTLRRLRVSYALAGDYDDIRALIYDIETATDFLVIDNVFLSEGADQQAPLTLTLDLSTYYQATPHAQ
ncbi:MAG TPA: GspMb/PilO family protein [Vicinamibacterales bacterium]|nr:GspMb/PilO family protein [Vicinamibacterales bacterium]